jgi:hypothetical protein
MLFAMTAFFVFADNEPAFSTGLEMAGGLFHVQTTPRG